MSKADWELVKLGDLAEVRGGVAFPPRFQGRSSGALPFYKVSDMNLEGNELLLRDANNWIDSDSLQELRAKPFPEGTVVFPKVGAALFTNKKRLLSRAALVDNNIMGVTLQTKRCLPEFLLFWFQSIDLGSLSNPGPLPSINGARVKEGLVPLPSVAEQARIVSVLQAVQLAKETHRRELSLERERKAALMEHIFCNGIARSDNGLTVPKQNRVPAEWRRMRLEECTYIQTGIAKGRKLGKEPSLRVPYLRVANVQDGYLNLAEMKDIEIKHSELARYELKKGDVVLTEGGDFDKLGRGFVWRGEVEPCVHQNHVFAVRSNPTLLIPEYLAYLVQSPYGRSYFLTVAHKTTNLACINKTKLGNFPVLFPNLYEQAQIVDIMSASDAKITALVSEITLLAELFDALLHELMSGRVDASEPLGTEASV